MANDHILKSQPVWSFKICPADMAAQTKYIFIIDQITNTDKQY